MDPMGNEEIQFAKLGLRGWGVFHIIGGRDGTIDFNIFIAGVGLPTTSCFTTPRNYIDIDISKINRTLSLVINQQKPIYDFWWIYGWRHFRQQNPSVWKALSCINPLQSKL